MVSASGLNAKEQRHCVWRQMSEKMVRKAIHGEFVTNGNGRHPGPAFNIGHLHTINIGQLESRIFRHCIGHLIGGDIFSLPPKRVANPINKMEIVFGIAPNQIARFEYVSQNLGFSRLWIVVATEIL